MIRTAICLFPVSSKQAKFRRNGGPVCLVSHFIQLFFYENGNSIPEPSDGYSERQYLQTLWPHKSSLIVSEQQQSSFYQHLFVRLQSVADIMFLKLHADGAKVVSREYELYPEAHA
jgi:hypothetical protein